MYAVRTAMISGFSKIEIRYDYEGIEKWVTGAWRSKTELTQKYEVFIRYCDVRDKRYFSPARTLLQFRDNRFRILAG